MAESASVLVVSDTLLLRASVVDWVLQALPDKPASTEGIALITQASRLGPKLDIHASSLDVIVSLAETTVHHTTAWLSEFARVLRPGGTLLVQEPAQVNKLFQEEESFGGQSSGQTTLTKKLLLAGFVGSETLEPILDFSLNIASRGVQYSPKLQYVMIKTQKLGWETGSSFAIKNKRAVPNTVKSELAVRFSSAEIVDPSSALPKGNGNSWRAPSYDIEFDDLIDEDSLLKEEDLIKPVLPSDDCEVGKSGKRACKNCTCGRAEQLSQQQKASLTAEQLNNPVSSCGSCGLGDAFRCETCPYRGLPPFQLGEKISLTGAFLTADI